LDVEFPVSFSKFVSAFSFVNLNVIQLIPVDCMFESNFLTGLITTTLFPIGLSGILFVIEKYFESRPDLKIQEIQEIRGQYFGYFLFLTFLVFPSVCTTIFQTFSCHKLDNGESYMRADYSIDCDSGEYTTAQVWAGLMIFVYPIGIPLLYFILLFSKRKDLNPSSKEGMGDERKSMDKYNCEQKMDEKEKRDEIARKIIQRTQEIYDSNEEDLSYQAAEERAKIEVRDKCEDLVTLSFLFEAYEPRMWWWEVFECLRRLMLTGMLIFCLPGTAYQMVIGILISQLTIKMYSFYKPFVEDDDDFLAEITQWQTFFVLFGALLIFVDVSGDDQSSQDGFSSVLIFVCIIPLFIQFGLTVKEVIEQCMEVKEDVNKLKSIEMVSHTKKSTIYPSDMKSTSISVVKKGSNKSTSGRGEGELQQQYALRIEELK